MLKVDDDRETLYEVVQIYLIEKPEMTGFHLEKLLKVSGVTNCFSDLIEACLRNDSLFSNNSENTHALFAN